MKDYLKTLKGKIDIVILIADCVLLAMAKRDYWAISGGNTIWAVRILMVVGVLHLPLLIADIIGGFKKGFSAQRVIGMIVELLVALFILFFGIIGAQAIMPYSQAASSLFG